MKRKKEPSLNKENHIIEITDQLANDIKKLTFKSPITHVYNPLEYARESHDEYLSRYGRGPRECLFLGMNPGPFGMAQTGVPFGEVNVVKNWMSIEASVGSPKKVHPKRPIEGFACRRSEVSGRRLWGWAKSRFKTPGRFFFRFLVINYCPLVFMEKSGKNRTPDKLPKAEKSDLFEICDHALIQTVIHYQPRMVVGVGRFAEKRALTALEKLDVKVGRITHPSPANPNANRGWESLMEKELQSIGIADF